MFVENYLLHYPTIVKKIKRDKNGSFSKGSVSWNKGSKGLHHSPNTEFKKGHLPANTKYNGCLSLRKKETGEQYYYTRISQGNWELYNRYLWKQEYGSIPKGMLIIFKDKNTLNCVIENLEMISRVENLMRNRNRKKMAETLKATWYIEKLRIKYGRDQHTKLNVGRITGINDT